MNGQAHPTIPRRALYTLTKLESQGATDRNADSEEAFPQGKAS